MLPSVYIWIRYTATGMRSRFFINAISRGGQCTTRSFDACSESEIRYRKPRPGATQDCFDSAYIPRFIKSDPLEPQFERCNVFKFLYQNFRSSCRFFSPILCFHFAALAWGEDPSTFLFSFVSATGAIFMAHSSFASAGAVVEVVSWNCTSRELIKDVL